MKLLNTYNLRGLELSNRCLMAPMTRSRATGNIPNALMASYYGQRAGAGLILTEATAVSPNGLGYPRIPGIFSGEQLENWKKITQVVHARGGKIFLQLFHTGRVSHPDNMPEGSRVLAPSAIRLEGEMYTDTQGMVAYPVPERMREEDIRQVKEEFVQAAINAIEAGFDGVEIHAANGYLLDQFQNPATNHRDDEYGNSIENRCRLTLEITKAIAREISAAKTGIRLSPYSTFNGTEVFDDLPEQLVYLTRQLDELKVAYLHLVDNRAMGNAEMNPDIFPAIRSNFRGTVIRNGGLDRNSGEKLLEADEADLIAYGRPFIANPDLVYRFSEDLPLNEAEPDTFYSPGEEGYTDYPVYTEEAVSS